MLPQEDLTEHSRYGNVHSLIRYFKRTVLKDDVKCTFKDKARCRYSITDHYEDSHKLLFKEAGKVLSMDVEKVEPSDFIKVFRTFFCGDHDFSTRDSSSWRKHKKHFSKIWEKSEDDDHEVLWAALKACRKHVLESGVPKDIPRVPGTQKITREIVDDTHPSTIEGNPSRRGFFTGSGCNETPSKPFFASDVGLQRTVTKIKNESSDNIVRDDEFSGEEEDDEEDEDENEEDDDDEEEDDEEENGEEDNGEERVTKALDGVESDGGEPYNGKPCSRPEVCTLSGGPKLFSLGWFPEPQASEASVRGDLPFLLPDAHDDSGFGDDESSPSNNIGSRTSDCAIPPLCIDLTPFEVDFTAGLGEAHTNSTLVESQPLAQSDANVAVSRPATPPPQSDTHSTIIPSPGTKLDRVSCEFPSRIAQSTVQQIRNILNKDLASSMYILEAPDFFSDFEPTRSSGETWYKIGIAGNVSERVKQISRACGIPTLRAVYESPVKIRTDVLRVIEAACHEQLNNFRRKMDCKSYGVSGKCDQTHGEWFAVPLEVAKRTVMMWETFAGHNPYAQDGELKRKWGRSLKGFTLLDRSDEQGEDEVLHKSLQTWITTAGLVRESSLGRESSVGNGYY